MKANDLRATLHGCLRPADGRCDCGREQWPHAWSIECVRREAELGERGSMATVAAHLPTLIALLDVCEQLKRARDQADTVSLWNDRSSTPDIEAQRKADADERHALDNAIHALSAVHAVRSSDA